MIINGKLVLFTTPLLSKVLGWNEQAWLCCRCLSGQSVLGGPEKFVTCWLRIQTHQSVAHIINVFTYLLTWAFNIGVAFFLCGGFHGVAALIVWHSYQHSMRVQFHALETASHWTSSTWPGALRTIQNEKFCMPYFGSLVAVFLWLLAETDKKFAFEEVSVKTTQH